jgi:hypothetical protein
VYQYKTEFYADFETVEKMLKTNKKRYRQKSGAKLEFVFFYTINLQKFLTNNFFNVHFFPIISTNLKSAKNLRIFYTHIQKINKNL